MYDPKTVRTGINVRFFSNMLMLSLCKYGVIIDRVVSPDIMIDFIAGDGVQPNTNHMAVGIYVRVPESSDMTDADGNEMAGARLGRFVKDSANSVLMDDDGQKVPVFMKVIPGHHWDEEQSQIYMEDLLNQFREDS